MLKAFLAILVIFHLKKNFFQKLLGEAPPGSAVPDLYTFYSQTFKSFYKIQRGTSEVFVSSYPISLFQLCLLQTRVLETWALLISSLVFTLPSTLCSDFLL